MPVLISAFIAVLSIAPIRFLQKRGIPDGVAGLLVFAGVVVTLVTLTVFVGASLRDFDDNLPGYETSLRESFSGILAWADEVGFGSDIRGVRDALDPKALMGFAQDL